MKIDFNEIGEPLFRRPELILHPKIPKNLFGVNPRTHYGQLWWDLARKLAYMRNNGCCWACGTAGPLEAHEAYRYNYEEHTATFVEVVALCNMCHMAIHLGRAHATGGQSLVNEIHKHVMNNFGPEVYKRWLDKDRSPSAQLHWRLVL